MKTILLLIYELLDVKYSFTDCGGEFNMADCEGCKEYTICKHSLERKEKGDKLKKLIEDLNGQPEVNY